MSTQLKLIVDNPYPIQRDTLRPFRIWNAEAKADLPRRFYAYTWTAIDAAWREIQWAKVHTTYEVYDATKVNRLIAAFTMKPRGNVQRYVKKGFNVRFERKKNRRS